MASSPSSSKNYDDADWPNHIQPFLDDLSNLHQQLSTIDPSHVGDRDRERLKLLSEELRYIQSAFKKLDPFGNHGGDRLSQLKDCIRDIVEHAQSAPESGLIFAGQKIHSLACSIANLKARLLWVSRVTTTNPSTYRRVKTGNWIPVDNELLKENRGDGYSSVFEGLVEDLDERARELFLHFAAFPLEKIINKRVLKNWWIADFLSQLPADKAENKADRVLEELELRCLIEAVRKRRRLVGFKIPHPWVHFALVRYAEEKKFFAFDSKWNPVMKPMTSLRGCLANTSDERSIVDQKLSKKEQEVRLENKEDYRPDNNYQNADLNKLQILFNISEQYPHLTDELFSRAKDIRVLSLGKWQSSNDVHIEVESTEFLKARKGFKQLRFFSLRGVSRVFKLPDDLCKLSSLTILDLKACHNLEELPDGIGSLKRLIYLDISECYLLEKLPKGLASLTELLVLKGFMIINTTFRSSSCSFKDLEGLNKLKKLGITAYRSDFPTKDDLETFKKFPLLEKLTILWGGKDRDTSRKRESQAAQEVQSQQANSSASPKSELQPRETNILSNTGEAASYSLEDSTIKKKYSLEDSAEPRKTSEDHNPPHREDNQEGTNNAVERKLSSVRNQEGAGNVAEKETEPRVIERTSNTGGVAEVMEPEIEEIHTNALNAGNPLERKDIAVKPETAAKGVNTGSGTRQGQPLEMRKKSIKKYQSLLKRTVQSSETATQPEEIFPSLEKLNLQCYPQEEAPNWLEPHNMKNLKKLYIVGGKLHNLKKVQGNGAWQWSVEILRLKYLEKLKTSWEHLKALFPKLIYYEKVQHEDLASYVSDPENVRHVKLTTFRCDREAEWVKKTKELAIAMETGFFEKERGLP